MAHEFYIVDVFAEEMYAGNQLGVFRNAADLSDMDMQRIAKEMNYSETTFILSDEKKDGGFDAFSRPKQSSRLPDIPPWARLL